MSQPFPEGLRPEDNPLINRDLEHICPYCGEYCNCDQGQEDEDECEHDCEDEP